MAGREDIFFAANAKNEKLAKLILKIVVFAWASSFISMGATSYALNWFTNGEDQVMDTEKLYRAFDVA